MKRAFARKPEELIDEVAKNVVQGRPGAHAAVIWTTEGFPASNDGDADASGRKVGTTLDNGTVFRVVSFGPGVQRRNHRTDSIDYAVVISGEIDMEMDGTMIHLKAGDVLVQRGTIHNWINTGTAPCVIAFALLDAVNVALDDIAARIRTRPDDASGRVQHGCAAEGTGQALGMSEVFIGIVFLRLRKPECISAEIERACARAARSTAGSRPLRIARA